MAKDFFGANLSKKDLVLNPYGFKKTSKGSCPQTIRNQLRVIYWKGKYEGECFCCGRKISYEHVHAGRIQAGANSGKYTVPNTRLICKTCNLGMGKQNLKIYMRRNFPERYQKIFGDSNVVTNQIKPKKKTAKRKIRRSSPYNSLSVNSKEIQGLLHGKDLTSF